MAELENPDGEGPDLLPPEVPQLRRLRRKREVLKVLQQFLDWVREHYGQSGLVGPPAGWDVQQVIFEFLKLDAEKIAAEEAAMAAYLEQLQGILEQQGSVRGALRPGGRPGL